MHAEQEGIVERTKAAATWRKALIVGLLVAPLAPPAPNGYRGA